MTDRVTPFIEEQVHALYHWRRGDHKKQALTLAKALHGRDIPVQVVEFYDSTCIYCSDDQAVPLDEQDVWIVEVRRENPIATLLIWLFGARCIGSDTMLRPTYHLYYRWCGTVHSPAHLKYEGRVTNTTLVLLFVMGEE